MAKNKEKDAEGHMHWADKIALEVKERVEKDDKLKEMVKEHGYVVYDEKTPSGMIHVGSGRSWMMHDVIAKSMRDLGLNATFYLSSDDIDPYDKPNKDLPESWSKYLGMPFRNMPSPVEGYESFAHYYFMQCVEKFDELGMEIEIESTGEKYESGAFNEQIKIILDNHEKVQAIFARFYGEDNPSAQQIPFNVICEKCGKIATTQALEWNQESEMLSYECTDKVKWAEGCGNKGKISPYNGNGKMPWKVEWAAKWPMKKVICEFAGKDHFTKGGSRTISIAIADEVLDIMPPYPSTRKHTGKGHEFFNIGGKKMSTSKGRGVAFKDMTTILPPKIIRFLLVRHRPNAVIDFDPEKDNDIILLFERYDQAERIYFGTETPDNDKEIQKQKRIYELSQIGDIPSNIPVQVPLQLAAVVIQVGLDEEGALNILKKSGHIPEDISGLDLHYVMDRLHDAKRWVDNFASDNYKFIVQDKLPESLDLDEQQITALKQVAVKLREKDWKDKELHDEFYGIMKSNDLEVKHFFKAAYNVLINKDRGPQLANFILTIGREKVADLFDQV